MPVSKTDSSWKDWLLRTLVAFFMIASTYYLKNINDSVDLVKQIQIEQVKDKETLRNIDSRVNNIEHYIEKEQERNYNKNSQTNIAYPLQEIPTKRDGTLTNTPEANLNFNYLSKLNTLFKH